MAILETAVKHNIDGPGIYDLTLDEYLADPRAMQSINSNGLRTILNECPVKYWWNGPNHAQQRPAGLGGIFQRDAAQVE